MLYPELLQKLYEHDFTRIERDDRLLDLFRAETREKGVELWQHWQEHEVEIVRVRLPYDAKKLKRYALARVQVEALLLGNKTATVSDFELLGEGENIFSP